MTDEQNKISNEAKLAAASLLNRLRAGGVDLATAYLNLLEHRFQQAIDGATAKLEAERAAIREHVKPWAGDTLTEQVMNAVCDIHTRAKCEMCGGSVRLSYAVRGMCPTCARRRIVILEAFAADYGRHTNDCPRGHWDDPFGRFIVECTCGYTKAIKGIKP